MFGQTIAQTSFFIRPQLTYKGQLTSSSASHFDNFSFNPSTNFHYQNNTLILPKQFSPLFLGMSVGVKINDRFLVELGLNQDESVCGATVSFINYEPVFGTYSDSQIKYLKGNSFGRYYLQSSYLLNKKGKNNKVYFDLGFGIAFRTGGYSTEKYDIETQGIIIDENNSEVTINSFIVKNNNKSFLFNFGFTDDIYFKGTNLLSISLFYSKSNSILNTVGSEITVNSFSENRTYNFSSFSKGSGIYFQLSRRLQFYPWLKKKK